MLRLCVGSSSSKRDYHGLGCCFCLWGRGELARRSRGNRERCTCSTERKWRCRRSHQDRHLRINEDGNPGIIQRVGAGGSGRWWSAQQ